MEHIYEVVHDHGEGYHPLAVFTSEEKARAFVTAFDGREDEAGGQLCVDWGEDVWGDEPEIIEIRRRPVDRRSHADGDPVARFKRTWCWTDDDEDKLWKTEEV